MRARKVIWVITFVSIALFTFIPVHSASAQAPIVITEIRALEFGICEIIAGQRYTVDPADNPGITGCTGSTSARFDLTGDPNARVIITLPNRVDITNGADILSVTTSRAPGGGNISFDATGNLTIWVGGNFRIPGGGLASSGLFIAPAVLDVVYK